MKILISTPLFPPENHYPANFSKNFATHLYKNSHHVTVATFSNFPEKVDNVNIIYVRKDLNIFLKMLLFLFEMIKNIRKQEMVVLKQAGFSSFLTALVAKVFAVKIILIMKEDEVLERINRQKISPNSFIVWRVKKLQKVIFNLSNLIIFDTKDLQEKMINDYTIDKNKTRVLGHPFESIYYPYDENLESAKIQNISHWEAYVSDFEKYTKTI